jgi:hypothetical protein
MRRVGGASISTRLKKESYEHSSYVMLLRSISLSTLLLPPGVRIIVWLAPPRIIASMCKRLLPSVDSNRQDATPQIRRFVLLLLQVALSKR